MAGLTGKADAPAASVSIDPRSRRRAARPAPARAARKGRSEASLAREHDGRQGRSVTAPGGEIDPWKVPSRLSFPDAWSLA
ncbi:hypothetical protein ABIB66_003693 [Bradyrhizobium sp. F1.13.3]